MALKTTLLFLSTVLQLIHLENLFTNATPDKPTVEIVTGRSNVFTGETVRLKCIVPATPYKSTWTYTWYNGPQELPYVSEQLVLYDVKIKDSGKYFCQGFRDTSIMDIPTFQSLPVEINVHAGWALLDAPSQGVVGYPLNLTCRVRGKRPIHEVVLYRDGVEVLKQEHHELILDNVTLADHGEYTCVASWDHNGRTHSIISAPEFIQIVEPLTEPLLIISDDDDELRSLSMLKLTCVLQYNVPAPAPPVLYYFYINNEHLGTPTTDNSSLIKQSRGTFKCLAKVAQLGLSRWSQPEEF